MKSENDRNYCFLKQGHPRTSWQSPQLPLLLYLHILGVCCIVVYFFDFKDGFWFRSSREYRLLPSQAR